MSWGETIFLKKFIQGEKRFVVSDAPIAELGEKSFLPKINGIVRIKTSVTQKSEYYDASYTLSVYLNDNIINTVTVTTSTVGETHDLFADVEVVKGNKYKAKVIKSGGASFTAKPITVCAQVTDANYFETEVI